MDVKKLIFRGKNLLLNPASEFRKIKEDPTSIFRVNKRFTLPLAAIVAICNLIASVLSNLHATANGYFFIGLNALIVFLIVLTHIYVSGKLIAYMGRNEVPDESPVNYYRLSTYSQLPFLLILALIKLFPSLVFLIFLGLYSGMIFYTGVGIITRIREGRKEQFTFLSLLVMIVSFIVFSKLFTVLYTEIVDQFSTFAAH